MHLVVACRSEGGRARAKRGSGRPPEYGSTQSREAPMDNPAPVVQVIGTFVDDVADGFVRAVDMPLGYEIINLGRGEPIELRAFIEGLETVAGGRARVRSVPKPACDMQHTHADITKARVLLGYQPRTGIREGSAALWRWYRDHTLEGAASLAPARPTLSAA